MIFNSLLFLILSTSLYARELSVNPQTNLKELIKQHDRDQDNKITVDDLKNNKDETFDLQLVNGKKVTVEGTYFLSNLLQELTLASEAGKKKIDDTKIFENPVDRLSRSIREIFWDNLTRKIDLKNLSAVTEDTKLPGQSKYLYVPESDQKALSYFKQGAPKGLTIRTIPKEITLEFQKTLQGKHGLLSLAFKEISGKLQAVPYVVPGGRFNEMYGWDSYFQALGLIEDDRLDLAQGLVDNLVYEINHYGKILNANRTYYLSRSQPPLLTSMIRAVYAKLPKNKKSRKWLEHSLSAAIKEYQDVWMGPERLTFTGLSRYHGIAAEIPPEVEKGHYNETLKPFANKHKLSIDEFTKKYSAGLIKEPKLDEFFMHDQAVRESGHDTTYRWRKKGEDRCSDFVTVDLNSLLYKIELDLAYLIKHQLGNKFQGISSDLFYEKARKRKDLIRKLLWDPKGGFFDFDWVEQKRSKYISATAFYPLWAHDPADASTKILTDKEAALLIKNLKTHLVAPGGLYASSSSSLEEVGGKKYERQWDYPFGWAPHQMIAWEGLRNYGMKELADELTYKWLYMITRNAVDYNGTVPEKYDVEKRSHAVFAEYGNVGTKFSYITKEGFGWMNASYQIGLKSLSPKLVQQLKSLTPPSTP